MYECTVGPIFNEKVVKKKRFVGPMNSILSTAYSLVREQ